jgi:hypothetical protein
LLLLVESRVVLSAKQLLDGERLPPLKLQQTH